MLACIARSVGNASSVSLEPPVPAPRPRPTRTARFLPTRCRRCPSPGVPARSIASCSRWRRRGALASSRWVERRRERHGFVPVRRRESTEPAAVSSLHRRPGRRSLPSRRRTIVLSVLRRGFRARSTFPSYTPRRVSVEPWPPPNIVNGSTHHFMSIVGRQNLLRVRILRGGL